jgi:hypothetical protein
MSPDYFTLEELVGLRPDFLFAVTVFDNDSGQAAPFTGPGLAMVNSLIRLGGGTDIFGSLKQSWTSVSWEKSPPPSPSASSSTTTAPHRRAAGEVPPDQPREQEPPGRPPPLLPDPGLGRGHPQPPQRPDRRGHGQMAAPRRRSACPPTAPDTPPLVTAGPAVGLMAGFGSRTALGFAPRSPGQLGWVCRSARPARRPFRGQAVGR